MKKTTAASISANVSKKQNKNRKTGGLLLFTKIYPKSFFLIFF